MDGGSSDLSAAEAGRGYRLGWPRFSLLGLETVQLIMMGWGCGGPLTMWLLVNVGKGILIKGKSYRKVMSSRQSANLNC